MDFKNGEVEGSLQHGEYVWLPRPAATPAHATPYAPLEHATAAETRLLTPPRVGSQVGAVHFAALPEAAGSQRAKAAGVVLVGEWWGIDTHALEIGRGVAAAGFNVLCLDIFRDGPAAIPVDATRSYDTSAGLESAFVESAHKMQTCDWCSALVDVAAAAEWLRQRTASAQMEDLVVNDRVGIVGCSFGAVLALLAATRLTLKHSGPSTVDKEGGELPSASVNAAVAFYGLPDDGFTGGSGRLWDPGRVVAPCQLHFPSAAPGLEGFDDVSKGRELLDAMRKGTTAAHDGGSHELHEYLVRYYF